MYRISVIIQRKDEFTLLCDITLSFLSDQIERQFAISRNYFSNTFLICNFKYNIFTTNS